MQTEMVFHYCIIPAALKQLLNGKKLAPLCGRDQEMESAEFVGVCFYANSYRSLITWR
jgi:hypothetical protein